MMKQLIILAFLSSPLFIFGQQPLAILKKMTDILPAIKNISYESYTKQKGPCDVDTANIHFFTSLYMNENGSTKACNIERRYDKGITGYSNVYSNGKWYYLDVQKMNYTTQVEAVEKAYFNILLLRLLYDTKEVIEMHPQSIQQMGDTIIQNRTYYHFFITNYDSITNDEHNFAYTTLVIDKKNYLPVYYKKEALGQGDKNNRSIGRVSWFEAHRFFNYKKNQLPDKPKVFIIPAGFKEELQTAK